MQVKLALYKKNLSFYLSSLSTSHEKRCNNNKIVILRHSLITSISVSSFKVENFTEITAQHTDFMLAFIGSIGAEKLQQYIF